MTFLFVIVSIAVIATVAILVIGRAHPSMGVSDTGDYRPELPDNPQFDVVVRGYRMDEVDAKIAELEKRIGALQSKSSPLSGTHARDTHGTRYAP